MREKYMLACALWCAIASAEGAEKNDAQPLRDKNGERAGRRVYQPLGTAFFRE
ncbi:hypothetical protein WDU71_21955 [Klebsiella pneumoniae]